MSTLYTLPLSLPEINANTVILNVRVGSEEVRFRFQWAIVSEEQLNLVLAYIDTKTKSDPLNDHGTYTYSYNYLEYYGRFLNYTEQELNDWLDTKPVLPNSILNAVRASQVLMLQSRIEEVRGLIPVVAQYKEVVKWQFKATYKGQVTTGYIEPGGWYRSQDPDMCFRFVSDLDYIGHDAFNNVTIEFEVNDGY